ncbi:MAG: helix-turn-helix transcriptional regulator [Jatrophihabitantaceae bacterium]
MKVDRVKGHLDLLLLGILSAEPGHGYAVITTLRDRTDGLIDLTEGAVYPALHRLEDLGLLASDWHSVAGRRRRLYRITQSGHAALSREKAEWETLSAAMTIVLRTASMRGVPA